MIVIGSTMTRFATGRPETSLSWLDTAEQIRESLPDTDIRFFAALELDAHGLQPFGLVLDRLSDLGGAWWTYTLDDGRTEVTSGNRYGHICAGRNLVTDYAQSAGASHILFLDADMRPPGDCLPKLLELNHPLAGGHVPTYGLTGPAIPGNYVHNGNGHPDYAAGTRCSHGSTGWNQCASYNWADQHSYPREWDVQEHMNTAGFLLVQRDLFRRLRWRWDLDAGMTDDPCYHADALALGVPTYVRHDVIGRHWPEQIPALEARGYDLTVARTPAGAAQ